MRSSAGSLELNQQQRGELERIVRAKTSPQRMVFRARIILASATRLTQEQVAVQTGTSRQTVGLWQTRFDQSGVAGLRDAPGRGRKRSLSAQAIDKVISEVVKPTVGLSRWSCRKMARHAGVSHASVQRLWRDNDLKPHLQRVFKVSKDARFEQKFWDVIGVYLDPPQNAVVLCCDEKSQCQALERRQPGLPLGQGHVRTRTHDYYRHGTVCLFAALDYLHGKIISQVAPRHRHQEWLRFLKQIERQTPKDLAVHLILDNYSAHKHPAVNTLAAHTLAISSPLHSDLLVMDEFGRAFLPRSEPGDSRPRQFLQRRGPQRSNTRLHRSAQPRSETLHLAG